MGEPARIAVSTGAVTVYDGLYEARDGASRNRSVDWSGLDSYHTHIKSMF